MFKKTSIHVSGYENRTGGMKFLAVAIFLAAFFPAAATADTTIDQLLEQIKALQAQMVALQQGSTQTSAQASTQAGAAVVAPSASCDLPTKLLRRGATGDEVSRLQQFLSRDTAVYPEAIVSGYFGALTELAVQRWQVKNAIVTSGTAETTGFGAVGPRTLAAMRLEWCLQSLVAPAPFTPSQNTSPTSGTTNTGTTNSTGTTNTSTSSVSATTSVQTQTPVVVPQSHVIFTAPAASTSVAKGGTIAITWKTDQIPPGASVSLSLRNKAGQTLGIIKNNLAANGTYYWIVPAPPVNSACTSDPITCLSQIAATSAGCTSLCTIESGLYKFYAQLVVGVNELAHAESRIFSIGGAALSSIDIANTGTVWNFTSGTQATSSYSSSFINQNIPTEVTSAPPLMCTYSGVPYSEGITLTVNCADVTVPGQGCGALGGLMLTCKSGNWVDQNGTAKSIRNITNTMTAGSCITPWMAQMVANGNQVPREPFFTNGVYASQSAPPLMKCSNGTWQTCNAIGSSCN
jgi:hypothetical protein